MIHSSNDSVIVSALRKGQVRRAVSLLIDSFNDELYAYCDALLGRAGAAVYQRALAAAIGGLAAFPGETSLRAWLFSITRREVLDYRWEHPDTYPGARDEGHCPLPRAALDHEDAALQAVPEADRELLLLRFWHGLRMDEVAFVVGRPPAEVRRRAGLALLTYSAALVRGGAEPC